MPGPRLPLLTSELPLYVRLEPTNVLRTRSFPCASQQSSHSASPFPSEQVEQVPIGSGLALSFRRSHSVHVVIGVGVAELASICERCGTKGVSYCD